MRKLDCGSEFVVSGHRTSVASGSQRGIDLSLPRRAAAFNMSRTRISATVGSSRLVDDGVVLTQIRNRFPNDEYTYWVALSLHLGRGLWEIEQGTMRRLGCTPSDALDSIAEALVRIKAVLRYFGADV